MFTTHDLLVRQCIYGLMKFLGARFLRDLFLRCVESSLFLLSALYGVLFVTIWLLPYQSFLWWHLLEDDCTVRNDVNLYTGPVACLLFDLD